MVSSSNHNLSACTYFRLELTTAHLNLQKEENGHSNNFMINRPESMGPARDQTCDPVYVVRLATNCAMGPHIRFYCIQANNKGADYCV